MGKNCVQFDTVVSLYLQDETGNKKAGSTPRQRPLGWKTSDTKRRGILLRSKTETQLRFKYFQASTLKATNQFYQKYQAISNILDANPAIIDAAHKDLAIPLKHASAKDSKGRRCKFTTSMVLRMLILMFTNGWSLRETTVRIDSTDFFREFVGIHDLPMMNYSTLCNLKNAISVETWKSINQLLARSAAEREIISSSATRIDTTAVETNIHYPTDSSLLWDVYRVLARFIKRARKLDQVSVGDKRVHKRSTKKLYTTINRQASRKGSSESLKNSYEDLISRVLGIMAWSRSVAISLRNRADQIGGLCGDSVAKAIAEGLENCLLLGAQVVDQAQRRVLQGEQVSNEEKIFSIFEPHTELLKRGKARRNIEYGHMIQIQQSPEKFITGYDVFRKRPVEHTLLDEAVENHKDLFDRYPDTFSADKGYYEKQSVRNLEEKVTTVSIGKKGKRTEEETAREHTPEFREAQRFRAGIEGSISFLKRAFRLARCLAKGFEHYCSTVGATIFAHNLTVLARC